MRPITESISRTWYPIISKMQPNKSFICKRHTPYEPDSGEHLTFEFRPFGPDAAPLPGGFTVKNLNLSLDPYQRGQMRLENDLGTYSERWIEDQPAVLRNLGTVLKSDNPGFKAGDMVSGMAAAAEHAAVTAEAASHSILYPALPPSVDIPPSKLISLLGVAGLTAYVSFHEFVMKGPVEGKTMFVLAASGGVGQLVGQMGKMHGMKVIGGTGGDD